MTENLLALIGLSEIMIENLGSVSIELESEMKRNKVYMHKPKQVHKKMKKLYSQLASELDASVQSTDSNDFIELCDFALQMTMYCSAIKPEDRIKALSSLKLLIK